MLQFRKIPTLSCMDRCLLLPALTAITCKPRCSLPCTRVCPKKNQHTLTRRSVTQSWGKLPSLASFTRAKTQCCCAPLRGTSGQRLALVGFFSSGRPSTPDLLSPVFGSHWSPRRSRWYERHGNGVLLASLSHSPSRPRSGWPETKVAG